MAKRPTPTANATPFTNATGAPVADNTNIMTAGQRGPGLLQDIWLIDNCTQADPAYGAGVARALGLTTAVAAE
jgi:catalase